MSMEGTGGLGYLLLVTVKDPNGLEDVSIVTVDLSAFGGGSAEELYDDGSHGDLFSNDGTYSLEIFVPENTRDGTKIVPVTVEDASGETDTDDLHVLVKIDDPGKDEGFLPGFEFMPAILCLALLAIFFRRRR
jgi:hypothetical protein